MNKTELQKSRYSNSSKSKIAKKKLVTLPTMDKEDHGLFIESLLDYAIFSVDKKGNITSWNNSCVKLFRYKKSEVLGKNFDQLFIDKNHKRRLQGKPTRSKKNLREEKEMHFLRKDGSSFCAQSMTLANKDADNSIVGYTKVVHDLTYRKQAEVTQEQLRATFTNAPAFICILRGKDHIFEYYNERYHQLVGHRPIIGKKVKDAIPEIEKQELSILNKVFAEGKPYIESEVKVLLQQTKRSPWREHIANFIYQPIFDSHDSVSGIFIHGIDVTDEVEAREKLAQSESEFKMLFNSVDEGFCTIKMIFNEKGKAVDYTILQTNPAFLKITGYKKPEGKTIKQLAPKVDDDWIRKFSEVARTGKSIKITQFAKSTERWFEISASAVGKKEEHKVALLFSDVTHIKDKEHALRESEVLFRSMADQAPLFVFLTNIDGSVSYTNQTWLEYTGRSFNKALGFDWESFMHPDDVGSLMKVFKRNVKQRTAYSIEHRIKGKNGKYHWFLTKNSPRYLPNGDFAGYIGISVDINDRKHAEEALRQQLDITKTITDTATACLFMVDNEGCITFMNPAATAVIGYTLPEVVGLPIHSLLHHSHPDGTPYPETECPMFQTYKKGKPHALQEDIYFRKNGEQFPALIAGTPIVSNGEVHGTVIEFRDISTEKKWKEALIQSEQRFRTLIEQSTDAIQMVSPEGNVLYTSDSIKNVLGYTAEELIGQNITPFVHPEDLKFLLDNIQYLLQHPEKKITIEYRVKHKDGSWAWLETTGVNHLNTPEIRALVGTFRNITERKKAQHYLEYQKSLLEALQEVSPLGVMVVTPEGKIATYNNRFAEMWKFSKEIMDTEIDEVALASAQARLVDPMKFIERVRELYRTHESSQEKIEFKDGRIFERYGAPMKSEDGNYFGYVWFFLDITEREKLVRQKDDFLGIASHELKTPVTSVKAYTQLLERRFTRMKDTSSAELISKMDIQLNKLTDLIGDLLDVTKIESGRFFFYKEKFDLVTLVRNTIEEIERTTTKHKIIQNISEEEIIMYGDKDRISQVLVNLLTNAIKYSPHADQIIVDVSSTASDVTVRVQDFGMGISDEKKDKIFERFYRISGPSEDTYPGLGLGLFISSEIVKRQGGRIWVESQQGVGSTFFFTVPKNSKENSKDKK